MSQQVQISKEDFEKMQNIKIAADKLAQQIGHLEFQKTKMVANLNEFHIASEKFVKDVIARYNLPTDKKIFIDENGFVNIEGEEAQEAAPAAESVQ